MEHMTQEEFDEWVKVAAYLKRAKARESELRNKLIDHIKEDTALLVGTTKVTAFDTLLKVAITEKLTVIESELDELTNELSEEEIACIKHKPSLDKKAYDKLPNDSILVLNCVTRKAGLPAISVV